MQVISFTFRPLYVCGKNPDTNSLPRSDEVRVGQDPLDKGQMFCPRRNQTMITRY
jgi:hypothetical protein